MKVLFQDFKRQYAEIGGELDEAYGRVMRSGYYILGPEVAAFETEWAGWCDSPHCAGVANALDGIELALRGLGVGPGDEVIVPANTYIATWLGVTHAGATVIPVDPDPATFCIGVEQVRGAVTPRTKAILPVHLYGLPVDLGPLVAFAREHGLLVVDDAAQGHGADWFGGKVGSGTDASIFSFYPTKNLGAIGDGGAVMTPHASLADRLKVMRNYGSRRRGENEVIGRNSRLDELQAALLRAKLPHLQAWTERRRKIAREYGELMEGVKGLILPQSCPGHAWHLYVVRHPDRDNLRARLDREGIETQIHYPIPPYRSGAYAHLDMAPEKFPVTERLAREVISLPIHPHLTSEEVQYIGAKVREACSGSSL